MINAFLLAVVAGLFLALSHTVLPRLIKVPWPPVKAYIYGTVTIGAAFTLWVALENLAGTLTAPSVVAAFWIIAGGAGFGTAVLGYTVDDLAAVLFKSERHE